MFWHLLLWCFCISMWDMQFLTSVLRAVLVPWLSPHTEQQQPRPGLLWDSLTELLTALQQGGRW